MRTFLLHTVVAILLVLFISACGRSNSSDLSDNVLRLNITVEVQDLDPQTTDGLYEWQVASSLFEGLTTLDPATMKAAPGVAESWDLSDDKLTYTFHLRQDAKWSNGDPVTANDFHYSFNRILSPALGAQSVVLLRCIENAQAFNEGVLADFSEVGIKVVDAHTLEFTLAYPTAYFPTLHSFTGFLPVHRATIEQYGAMDELGTRWTRPGNHVGNGPFRLTEWHPNEYIRVVRNEHYWDRDRVRLDGIQFFPVDDRLTEERLFRAGKFHMTGNVPMHKVPVYQREHPELIHIDPFGVVGFYKFNVTRKPFDDPRVRQAFSLAIDRTRLTENILTGGETSALHLVPPGIAGYESSATLTFDPERAQALLAEAGFPNGNGFPSAELLYNTSEEHRTVAEAIQQMWKKNLNVEVQLYNQDWKVYLDSVNKLDYGIARAGWVGGMSDSMFYLELAAGGGAFNNTGYSNPAFDALLDQAYAEANIAKRSALLRQAEDILLEDLPLIPLFFGTYKYLQVPELKGYVPNPEAYFRFKDMYLEPATGPVLNPEQTPSK